MRAAYCVTSRPDRSTVGIALAGGRASGRVGATTRIGAVFGVAAGGALLGMVLLSAPVPLIPTYEAQLGTARALTDQRSAAAPSGSAGC